MRQRQRENASSGCIRGSEFPCGGPSPVIIFINIGLESMPDRRKIMISIIILFSLLLIPVIITVYLKFINSADKLTKTIKISSLIIMLISTISLPVITFIAGMSAEVSFNNTNNMIIDSIHNIIKNGYSVYCFIILYVIGLILFFIKKIKISLIMNIVYFCFFGLLLIF
jgi:hypothetical protein